jgi:hypothetical protein
MSMPFTVFSCRACDFKGSSMAIWGQFSYEGPAGLVPVERCIGWCMDCDDLVPMEVLPSSSRIAELEAVITQAKRKLNEFRRESESRRSILGKIFNSKVELPADLEELDRRMYYDEGELKEQRIRLALLSRRSSPAKCLFCGSSQVEALPRQYRLSGSSEDPGAPAGIGWKHPRCGGDFEASHSGVRISKRLQHRVFTTDGEPLRIEESMP